MIVFVIVFKSLEDENGRKSLIFNVDSPHIGNCTQVVLKNVMLLEKLDPYIHNSTWYT